MSEKKVIAFIVEGPSEEASLGSIMKEYFSSNEVQFVVIHGDITTKDYVSTDNILKKINDRVEEIQQRYRYNVKDFMKIIHLTDADGVFVDDELVKHANVDSIQYLDDCMETRNVETTIERNHRKAEILFKLRKAGKINGIPYKIYFNSCNLEHVLYGELNDFTDDEKEMLSDDFADKYEGNVDEFVEFISNTDVATPGTYQQTWNYLEKGTNSLKRGSNMHLIFEKNK